MKTKPFDLTAAMNGAKLVTRDGREAKFIAYVPEVTARTSRLLALVEGRVYSFSDQGNYVEGEFKHDLFLAVPTRSINGHEYPEPERVEPEKGTNYFVPSISNMYCFVGFDWANNGHERRMLRRGLVHLTREAAEAHARAIILAGGGEV